jgi:hypothetical protein
VHLSGIRLNQSERKILALREASRSSVYEGWPDPDIPLLVRTE